MISMNELDNRKTYIFCHVHAVRALLQLKRNSWKLEFVLRLSVEIYLLSFLLSITDAPDVVVELKLWGYFLNKVTLLQINGGSWTMDILVGHFGRFCQMSLYLYCTVCQF